MASPKPRTPPDGPISVREYLRQRVDGHTLTSLAAASGVSYSTLYRHAFKGDDLRAATAKRLEAWSRGTRVSDGRPNSSRPIGAAVSLTEPGPVLGADPARA